MGIKRTAAGRIYYDAEDDRQSQVLGLLGQIGDRLQRSDSEREELARELQDYRRLVSDLEDKAAKAEKIVAAVSGKVGKVETIEAEFAKRQEIFDRAAQEQAQKIARVVQVHADVERRLIAAENAAASFESRIAETLDQQGRLNRKLEKIAQDKIRLLRKLERMEEVVAETQDALRAKAMVLLTDRSLAPETAVPALTESPSFIRRSDPSFDFDSESAPLWRRPVRLQATVLGILVLLSLGVGWLVGLGFSSPAYVSPAPVLSSAKPVSSDQGGLALPQIPLSPIDPLASTDQEMVQAFEKAPDALASRLNAIEPSSATLAAAPPPKSLPPAAVMPQPVSLPPPDSFEGEAPAPTAPKTKPKELRKIPDSSKQKSVEKKVSEPLDPLPPVVKTTPNPPKPQASAPLAPPLTRVVDVSPDPSLPPAMKDIEEKAMAGVAEAQHDLAAVYTAGHAGVAKNYEKASFWFGKAAGQGVANARYNLGVLYQQGLGVPKDMREAIKWYRAAADIGHPEARYNLGISYIEGVGVAYDPVQAAAYFESAAAGGVTEAAYNLGLIHENGLLGKPHPEEALLWYKKAADKGSQDARAALEQLAKSLRIAPEDLDRAVSRAQTDALLDAGETGLSAPPPSVGEQDDLSLKEEKKPLKKAKIAPPPVPAPPMAEEAMDEVVRKTATLAGSLDRIIISQIQDQLKDMGMYNGPSDGSLGPMTADAIRSYQIRNDLPVDGSPTESLLIHMLAREIRD